MSRCFTLSCQAEWYFDLLYKCDFVQRKYVTAAAQWFVILCNRISVFGIGFNLSDLRLTSWNRSAYYCQMYFCSLHSLFIGCYLYLGFRCTMFAGLILGFQVLSTNQQKILKVIK